MGASRSNGERVAAQQFARASQPALWMHWSGSSSRELRQELRRLVGEVVLPALEEQRQQLQSQFLQPALAELRTQVRRDFTETLHGQHPYTAAAPGWTAPCGLALRQSALGPLLQHSTPLTMQHPALRANHSPNSDHPVAPPHSRPTPLKEGLWKGGHAGHGENNHAEAEDADTPLMMKADMMDAGLERDFFMLQQAVSKGEKVKAAALFIVTHTFFDYMICAIIVVNALMVGVETDLRARQLTTGALFFRLTDLIFCFFFITELTARLLARSSELFSRQKVLWTLLEICIVGCQALDVTLGLLHRWVPFGNISLLNIMRLLRVFRISRIVRIFHFVVELRSLLASILGSMRTLLWVIALYFILVFVAGTFFTQVVAESRAHSDEPIDLDGQIDMSQPMTPQMKLHTYFGSLGVTILSLWESVSGGMDWKDMADPLFKCVSPTMGFAYLLYVVFAAIAMMNVVTGIFVSHAMRHAEEDQDAYIAKNVIGTLQSSDLNGRNEITLSMWEARIDCPEMQALFKAVGVDKSDAQSLFRLIDLDDNGVVDSTELINGWIRLRGAAKSLDLAILMKESDRANQAVMKSLRHIQDNIALVASMLGSTLPTGRTSFESEDSVMALGSYQVGPAKSSLHGDSQMPAPQKNMSQMSPGTSDGHSSAHFEAYHHPARASEPAMPRYSFTSSDSAEPKPHHSKPFRSTMRPLRRSMAY